MPSTQVAVANVAMIFLDMTGASPTTSPARRGYEQQDGGGVRYPHPRRNSSATSGISNSNGTLIKIPRVAAISTPWRLSR
jgi:hypothetical protein